MMRWWLGLLLAAVALRAETAVEHLLESKMYARIKAFDEHLSGVLGVATIDLTSGRIFVYNGEAIFPTASSIKIPILAQMFRTVKDLDAKVTLQPDKAVGGSGDLQNQLKRGPVSLTVRDLMRAMIENSDNTATNRCIDMVGMERVNQLLAGAGMRSTRLRRVMMDSAAAAHGDENTSSPLEMARLVEMLYRGRLGNPAATSEMIEMLKLVKASMREAIPAAIEVASKPGDLERVRCEAGIVYLPNRPFVVSIFSTFLGHDEETVKEVTGIVFEYFSRLATSNPYGHKVR